ncbi:MAG: YihY/virulence factor BrkB family protein [Anaerolineae bacterium]
MKQRKANPGCLAFLHFLIQSLEEDDCFAWAAAIAYYALISFFPLLLILIVAASYFLERAEAKEEVMRLVAVYIPTSEELVRANIEQVLRARGAVGVLAMLGFLWSASVVFSSLERALNRVWEVRVMRPFWRRRLLAVSMIAGLGALFLLSVASTALFDLFRHLRLPFHLDGWMWGLLTASLPIFLNVLIFSLLYKILPYRLVGWSEALPGALLAGLSWEGVKKLFTSYLIRVVPYNLVYGSLGAVIALLIWFYITAFVLLLGAEFSAILSRVKRKKRGPEELF